MSTPATLLHEFVTANRRELIMRTRAKVLLRSAPVPTESELERGIPIFLDQLVEALKRATPFPETVQAIGQTATAHGGNLLKHGFSVSQVVYDYGDVCQAVTELANETDSEITTEEFHTLNKCLDDAIAEAVTEYMRLREEVINEESVVRAGVFAHELRNRLSAATMGFELLKKGTVPLGGSVAALISRNLAGLSSLINRSLVEVRLSSGIQYRQRVAVADLIEEAEVDASMQAAAQSVALTVTTVPHDVEVDVDRQIVAGAIANLMQNAFKFTTGGGAISLRTSTSAERVLIEVQDGCGGLPPTKAAQLFQAFRQHGDNRSGLGLGLFISRKGVEANGGILRVMDVPGRGCIFTIDLPRFAGPGGGLPAPAAASLV
ncbi:MAG TPA: HAMP domain-containing sensor histidine kinase [Polyangia bacterium]